MENLASRQLAIAACGATILAGAMLSHDNRLGFAFLALAAACGIGAFARRRTADQPIADSIAT